VISKNPKGLCASLPARARAGAFPPDWAIWAAFGPELFTVFPFLLFPELKQLLKIVEK
jgi:hypothetical protein